VILGFSQRQVQIVRIHRRRDKRTDTQREQIDLTIPVSFFQNKESKVRVCLIGCEAVQSGTSHCGAV
jgi:aspartyl-tRNA synthetase